MTASSKGRQSIAALNWLKLFGWVALGLLACRDAATSVAPPELKTSSPLAALPAGAELQVTLDMARFRASALGALLTKEGRTLSGVGSLEQVCGFDPARKIRAIAVAVSAASRTNAPDFGVAATGNFSARRLVACARRVIRRRGGSPVETRIGSFVAVRDRRGRAGEVAVRDGGPVLLGAGDYLLEMIDAADGRAPNATSDELHQALQRAVGVQGALVATWVLPARWLEQWAGAGLARASPLSQVRAIALRVNVTPEIEAHAVVGCTARSTCQEVHRLLSELLTSSIEPRLTHVLGHRLAHPIELRTTPREVHIDLIFTKDEASILFKSLLAKLPVSPRDTASDAGAD